MQCACTAVYFIKSTRVCRPGRPLHGLHKGSTGPQLRFSPGVWSCPASCQLSQRPPRVLASLWVSAFSDNGSSSTIVQQQLLLHCVVAAAARRPQRWWRLARSGWATTASRLWLAQRGTRLLSSPVREGDTLLRCRCCCRLPPRAQQLVRSAYIYIHARCCSVFMCVVGPLTTVGWGRNAIETQESLGRCGGLYR
jgi:hypothetical protein